MQRKVTGEVVSAKRQWWLKVNSKPGRMLGTDGALYPYVVTVRYEVDGKGYTKRKWIKAGGAVPEVGARVIVAFEEGEPGKPAISL